MAATRRATHNGVNTQNIIRSEMQVCDNITDTAIRITESKARLVYRDHIKCGFGERTISAISFFLTFLITICTSTFNDVFGIENSKYILFSGFVILTIVSFVLSIIFFVQWIKNKKNNEDSFILALKGNDDVT